MNPVDFCYWLQGSLEINTNKEFDEEQVEIIQAHLSLVFKHSIDPARERETTVSKNELDFIHSNKNPFPNTKIHSTNDLTSTDNDPLMRC